MKKIEQEFTHKTILDELCHLQLFVSIACNRR